MNWISVEDELPEVFKQVMTAKTGRLLGIDERLKSGGFSFWDDEVTHWMPLPEPPQPEGK